MSCVVVGAPRSRLLRSVSCSLVAFAFAPRVALAQEIVTQPRAPVALPPDAPLVTPRPDFVLRAGSVSAGTAGKFILARETDLSQNLHSTLSGSMALASPGDWSRAGDIGVRHGFLLWTLRDRRGCRGGIGLAGDPTSTTIQANLTAPLPAAISLDAQASSRASRSAHGDVRVDHASVALRRPLTRTLVMQPRVYVFDVHARNDIRWIGSALRFEYRGAEFCWNHEGERGSRATTRKTWQRGHLQWTLGGHLERHPIRADRSLWECAVARNRCGIALYTGDTQRGILMRAGFMQLGFVRRASAHQTVLGCKNVSLSMLTHADGKREFGFSFVYGDWLRSGSRTATGWQWQPVQHRSAVDDARLRWPGLATLAN